MRSPATRRFTTSSRVRAAPVVGLSAGECRKRAALTSISVELRAGARQPDRGDAVLVTGATGRLGPHLLAAWRAADPRPLVALVRAPDAARSIDGVEVVRGDLTAPALGLSHATWARIGTIVHAGAAMSLAGGWAEHAPVNVGGTAELVGIARARDLALVHVSTLSVFASTDRAAGRHDRYAVPSGVAYGGYAQTKIAAEAIVDLHPRTKTARLGLLVGAPRDRDQLAMTLRALTKLGAVPALGDALRIDLTPVRFAADAIVALALHGEDRDVIHVASPRPASYAALVAPLKLPAIAPAAWAARARAAFADPDIAMAYLSLGVALGLGDRARAFDLFLATGADFAPDAPAPDVDLDALVHEVLA